MNFAIEFVNQNGKGDFFFIAQQLGSLDLVLHIAMLPQAFPRVCLSYVDEQELDSLILEFFVQLLHVADRASRKRACCRSEGQHDIALMPKIIEADLVAIQGLEFEVRSPIARIGSGEFGFRHVLQQAGAAKFVVVITG